MMIINTISMRLSLVVAILLLLAAPCHAQVSYCFRSTDGNNLNLKFTLIDQDWKYGYIQYNKPQYGIFIRQKYNHAVESLNEPGMREYMWEEVRNDSVTGTYQFMKLGDVISNIRYKREKDKKEFRFETTNVTITDCQCDW